MPHLRPMNSSCTIVAEAGHLIIHEKPEELGKLLHYADLLSNITNLHLLVADVINTFLIQQYAPLLIPRSRM
jgi:hypothetical protein